MPEIPPSHDKKRPGHRAGAVTIACSREMTPREGWLSARLVLICLSEEDSMSAECPDCHCVPCICNAPFRKDPSEPEPEEETEETD